jgi:hypothetical protein
MITGIKSAPWEENSGENDIVKKLGYMREPVLAMLHRDPKLRPSMAEFHKACLRLLCSTTAT